MALHDEAFLFDIMQDGGHRTPLCCHRHRYSLMSVGQGLGMRSTRANTVVFWLGALWPPNAAWIIERRATKRCIGIVIVAEGTGTRQSAVIWRTPAQWAHMRRGTTTDGAIRGWLEGLGRSIGVGMRRRRRLALGVAGKARKWGT
jgi:hypothetical protein